MFVSLKHKFKIWPRSKHTQSRVTKTCTGTNKKQKKQTTRCTKPAEAPTKKKLEFPRTMGPLLSSCWIFVFCFFWCLSMFGASTVLFCDFWCLSMFCEVRVAKPALAPKKTNTQKFPGTMGPLLSSCWIFFCFCGACRCLVHLVVCFLLVPVNVLWSQSHQTCTGTQEKQKKQTTTCTKPAQAPNKTNKQKNNNSSNYRSTFE